MYAACEKSCVQISPPYNHCGYSLEFTAVKVMYELCVGNDTAYISEISCNVKKITVKNMTCTLNLIHLFSLNLKVYFPFNYSEQFIDLE